MGLGAGGEFVGGGSGATATIPKNLILGGASESVPSIIIPGLSGDPDVIPSSPLAANDEFDDNGNGVPAGWSSFGAGATFDTNSVLSNLHIKGTASANVINSLFKTTPAAPFTVTTKMTDYQFNNTGVNIFNVAGLYVGVANPGTGANAFTGLGISCHNGGGPALQTFAYTSSTSNPAGGNTLFGTGILSMPLFFRISVNAAGTTATYSISINGLIWTVVAVIALGFTVASCGIYAVASTTGTPGLSPEAYFDYVRFTTP